jgi:uncharacterized membrane protein YhaH (DUF805 family)
MKLLRFAGRAARMEYFLHTFLDGFVMMLIIMPVMLFTITPCPESFSEKMFNTIGVLAIITVIILATISEIAVTVRRLHDLGRPGSHYWRLLIPIYNFFLGLVLLFSRGVSGANEYGPDPLQKE